MKNRKKKILTLDEFFKYDNKEYYRERYKKSLSNATATDNDENTINSLNLNIGKYSLRARIKNNPWLKSGKRPASEAQKWLFREVFKNPTNYRYGKLLMFQGGLFTFEYKNPKYKGQASLPWFDKYPLVISLGPVVTKLGIRNLGFNLHLLPPKVRIVAICKIFDIYKKLYRYQIFYKQERPVQIKYQTIIKMLKPYGLVFSVRMYIPSRMKQIVHFPYRDWHKAIFVPSRGYDSIKAAKLIQEWQKHIRKLGYSTSSKLDWKTLI